jgi:hypothetical protein
MSTQNCECIKVTYTLEGGSPVTVEVEKEANPVNGKNFFFIFISGLPYSLFWNGTFWKISQGPGADQATLSSDTPCPFGDYTLEESSIFEAFEVNPCTIPSPYVESINCYKLAVWNKQCEYSKCVLEYVNNLIFGIDVCKLEESLKEQRRILEILNCYDPRDILGNTTNYNTITYTKIKQLLNHL